MEVHVQMWEVSSASDISKSSVAESSGISNDKWLLRLKLTDGHSEVTAIEFTHIPSISDNVFPGTKVYHFSKKIIVLQKLINGCLSSWEVRRFKDGSRYTS